MKKNYAIFLFLLFTSSITLLAQNITVTGTVRSAEDQQPLPGASVVIQGTNFGAVTDINGKYSISFPKGSNTIEFKFTGYNKETVVIYDNPVIDILLTRDLTKLNEVVVVGYGVSTVKKTTGAISQVSGSKLENLPVATIDQALQGNIAGLQLGATSGTPGSIQDVRIRGVNSITASSSPLYVIDGVPVVNFNITGNDYESSLSALSSINSNDIKSISVLKDAAATSAYGARGANGVILITTKSGNRGKTVFTATAERGFTHNAVKGQDVLNAPQWNELYNEAKANYLGLTVADFIAKNGQYSSGWDGKTNTDWGDVVERNKALQQQYNISASGGNEKSQHFFSLGYFSQEATTIGSDFERFNAAANFSVKLRDNIKVNNNLTGSYTKHNGFMEQAAYFSNPRLAKYFFRPTWKAYNDDGSINLNTGSFFNPLYVVDHNINRDKPVRISDNFTFEWDLFKKLKYTSKLAVDFISSEKKTYQDKDYGDGASQGGYIEDDYTRNYNWVWQNTLDYSWDINTKNKLDIKFLHEAQQNKYYYLSAAGTGIPANGLPNLATIGTVTVASSNTSDWSLNSYLLLLNYSFNNRLFLDATIRREGSSKFSPGNQWGNFGAVGASYLLSDESFLEGTKNWLSLLKLRASYGRTGNAGIDVNSYQALLSLDQTYNSTTAAYPSQFGNTKLSWEKSDDIDLGFSFGLFDNRISGEFTYFNKKTFDLLQDVPLSLTTGHSSQYQNVGELVNKGIEASIDFHIIKSANFNWKLGANVTWLKNEVTKLATDASGNDINIVESTRKVAVGQPVYAWYLQTWAGVDPANGDPLWYVNGKSGATTNNYASAGKDFHGSAIPTLYGGVNTSLDFKGVFLDATLYGSFGNEIYDLWVKYTQSDGLNTTKFTAIEEQYTKRWQKVGDNAEVPKIVYGGNHSSNSASSRFLYDGSFLRLKNVALGYKIPDKLLKIAGISNAKIYLRGVNLWTYTYDHRLKYDPEVGADGSIGLTNPPVKSYTLGLQFNF